MENLMGYFGLCAILFKTLVLHIFIPVAAFRIVFRRVFRSLRPFVRLFLATMPGRPKCPGRLGTLWDTRGCGKQLPDSSRATSWNCVECGLRLCRTCCDCDGGCGFGGRGAVNGVYVGSAAPPAPAAPPVPRARSRSREGRRYSRAAIESHLLSQWRHLAIGDRPLPPAGRQDSGLNGYGTWAQGLLGDARRRTRELLDTEQYRQHRCVSSVHVSLYLRWAEDQLRAEEDARERQQSSRVAAMDLRRHIQSFSR